MPRPRTLILLQCTDATDKSDIGAWYLAETYATSDGPRMRLLGSRRTVTEAREWMAEVEERLK